jgi:hypothetical protein
MIPAVLIQRFGEQLAIIDLAIVGLIAWYHHRRGSQPTIANAHAVAAKYPIIAWAVSPIRPPVLVLIASYVGFAAFELLDDAALRADPRARRVAMVELGTAIVGLAALLAL